MFQVPLQVFVMFGCNCDDIHGRSTATTSQLQKDHLNANQQFRFQSLHAPVAGVAALQHSSQRESHRPAQALGSCDISKAPETPAVGNETPGVRGVFCLCLCVFRENSDFSILESFFDHPDSFSTSLFSKGGHDIWLSSNLPFIRKKRGLSTIWNTRGGYVQLTTPCCTQLHDASHGSCFWYTAVGQ